MVNVERQRSASGSPQWLFHLMLLAVLFCFLLIRPGAAGAACGPCGIGGGGTFSTCCSSASEASASFSNCNCGMLTVYVGCPDISDLPPDIAMWYTPFSGYVQCRQCDEHGELILASNVFFGVCEDPCAGMDPCVCDPSLCHCQ